MYPVKSLTVFALLFGKLCSVVDFVPFTNKLSRFGTIWGIVWDYAYFVGYGSGTQVISDIVRPRLSNS